VIQTLLNRANKYIGQSSLDGLTLVSMQTQLTQDLVDLQTRGYCTRPSVKIQSTPAQRRSGDAIDIYRLGLSPTDTHITISRAGERPQRSPEDFPTLPASLTGFHRQKGLDSTQP
jgi:hypothetical protein